MEKMATSLFLGVEGVEEAEEGVLEDGAEFEEVQVALAEVVDVVKPSAGGFKWEFVTFLVIFGIDVWHQSFYIVTQKGHL